MAPSRNRRPGFSRRAQFSVFFAAVLAIAGLIVGAVLLVLSIANPLAFGAARAAVAELTAPVAAATGVVVRTAASVPEAISTHFRVRAENEALRAEVARTRAALFTGRQAVMENVRLRALLRVRDSDPKTVIVSRIVSVSSASTRRYGLLYAGQWQRVVPGQPVRGPDGLIGRVMETGPNTARVLLITDAESVVPVRRIRDGQPALAAGRGDGLLDIRTIDADSGHFRAGDVYVTSGTGGIFVPGVPVARVLRTGNDSAVASPFARADIMDFATVSEAFVPAPPPAPPPVSAGGRRPPPDAATPDTAR